MPFCESSLNKRKSTRKVDEHFSSLSYEELDRNNRFYIDKFIIKPIIASLLMGISSMYVYNFLRGIIMQNIAILLAIIIAILVYVISLIIVKVFDKDELYMLPFYSKISKKIKV